MPPTQHSGDGPRAAPASALCGPFLRYQNMTMDNEWLGSVLVCTSEGEGTSAQDQWVSGDSPLIPSQLAPAGPASEEAAAANGGAASPAVRAVLSSSGQALPTRAPVQLLLYVGSGAERLLQPRLLDASCGWKFWRFDLRLKLGPVQRRVRYTLQLTGTAGEAAEAEAGAWGQGDAGTAVMGSYDFWVPAAGQPMHAGYYSCAGISADVPATASERSDPWYLWRDVLQVHSAYPMHVIIGGGDQVYSDLVWRQPPLVAWLAITSRKQRLAAPWTAEMAQAAERFYVRNYMEGLSQKEMGEAMARIPQVMMYDDHDITDGWGSYAPPLQQCPVFQGLFGVAKRFYLLFQHHTTQEINQQTKELFGDGEHHFLKMMGPQMAILGIDMRARRTRDRIMPPATYALLSKVLAGLPANVEHLLVMSGVPLVFPQVPAMETLLDGLQAAMSKHRSVRDIVKKGGLSDQFGNPGILDDLVDGWAAKVHKAEKLEFVRLLQGVSLQRGIRVSILSGDAHVCGVGRLYSHPKYSDPSLDPLMMTQIISSAIMNAPPPRAVVHTLHRTNWAKNLDGRTREKMVRLFKEHHPRFHKLLRKRNWCDIVVMLPPHGPPMSPLDPLFGGLRFSLRCENASSRRGHAEEVYDITVPRLLTGQHKGEAPEPAAPAVTVE